MANKFHCQKIIFHKATMDSYEKDLKSQGLVIYLKTQRKRTENNLNYLSEKGLIILSLMKYLIGR